MLPASRAKCADSKPELLTTKDCYKIILTHPPYVCRALHAGFSPVFQIQAARRALQ